MAIAELDAGFVCSGRHGAAKARQGGRLDAQAPGDPLDCAEQIDQHGHGGSLPVGQYRLLQQQCRPVRREHTPMQLGHFQLHMHRLGDAAQLAAGLDQVEEGSQIDQGRVRESGKTGHEHAPS